MNKSLLVVLLGVALIFATVPLVFRNKTTTLQAENQEVLQAYQAWKQKYGRLYSAEEDQYRLQVFTQKYYYIQEYNQNNDDVKLAINQFSDLTLQEFKSLYMGRKRSNEPQNMKTVILDTANVPTSIDWRQKGAVTHIKNQGQCGSCWAFSTVGGCEGGNFLKTGSLVSLSEQQIVDCSHNGGNSGCDGGDLPPAYTYVEGHGLESESDYPYTAEDDNCQYDKSKVVYTPSGFSQVTPNDPDQLQAAAAQQPVSVCIEADSDVFQSYSSGILSSSACGTELDHCVTLVGYDFTGSKPYWIVKNSWGTDWGMDGYVEIANKSGNGVCGINEEPVYPTN